MWLLLLRPTQVIVNNYRERLGTLLDDGKGAEQKVDGVNNLWKALAIWINKKDDSYRKIVLPEPGSWTLIGYAAKLAYPSRKDRADLKKFSRNYPIKHWIIKIFY